MTDTFTSEHIPMPAWTDEELLTLVEFRRRNGNRWKRKLLDLYLFGTDDREPNGAALRWIRNRQGPSRVDALRKATLDEAEARLAQPPRLANNTYIVDEDHPMSRHEFESGTARVSIGWDAPLATFFLQVWTGDRRGEDDAAAIWLGGFYGEAPSPVPLIVVAREHVADLPSTLHRQLIIDQLAAPARPRRPGLTDPPR